MIPLQKCRRASTFLLLALIGGGCTVTEQAPFVDEAGDDSAYTQATHGLNSEPARLLTGFAQTDIPESSSPAGFVQVGSEFFFAASDAQNGRELWKSEGKAKNTVLVKDIVPGSGSSSPSNLTDVNGTLFFTVTRTTGAPQLWKSDGTEAGTVFVSGVYGVESVSALSELTNVDGTLFFVAVGPYADRHLWRSDGTEAGTLKVSGDQLTSLSSPAYLTDVAGTLFFSATSGGGLTGVRGHELWKVEGSSANASLVLDIQVGAGSSSPRALTNVDGLLGFTAVGFSKESRGLWVSDGTPGGTVLVKNFTNDWSGAEPMVAIDGTLFFAASETSGATELWKSDLTVEGTQRVVTVHNNIGGSNPTMLTNVDGTLYYNARSGSNGSGLWKSDGTSNGTRRVADLSPATAASLTDVDDTLFFTISSVTGGTQLWKSNGTLNGTVQVSDTVVSQAPGGAPSLLSFNGDAYFGAQKGSTGVELWTSNGTMGGTVLVKDIAVGNVAAAPEELATLHSTLLFAGRHPATGTELWVSDGTPAGTELLKDIFEGSGSSSPRSLTTSGDKLFFTADDGAHGRELWRTDGTAEGTVRVKDINAGAASSSPMSLVDVGGTLFFTAFTAEHGRELWKSDGSEAGTVLVQDLVAGNGSSSPAELTALDGKLYFVAHDGSNRGLWRSNGTGAGTVRIDSTESSLTDPMDLTTVDNTLFFTAMDRAYGRELRKTDGTLEEAELVKDITPGRHGSALTHLTHVEGTLYFRLGINELWVSNGTSAGTRLLHRLGATAKGAAVSDLTNVGATLFFAGDDGMTGVELWKSDGTPLGTRIVKDIVPGAGGYVTSLVGVGDALAFAAFDPATGLELWRTDGEDAGTRLVQDLYSGTANSSPLDLTLAGTNLFFSAEDEYVGRALYVLDRAHVLVPDSGMACPDWVVEAVDPYGVFVSFSPYALEHPLAPVKTSPLAGSRFALGQTTVTASVPDYGLSCTFTVTVRDTTKPALTCPDNVVAEADSQAGAAVHFPAATATDAVSTPSIEYARVQGSVFAIGESTVLVTATDEAGNVSTCPFTVTVVDTTPPELTCPDDVVVQATEDRGAVAHYDPAFATDTVLLSTLTYSKASGDIYARGETTVVVTAKDSSQNSSTCSFKVTVVDTSVPTITCPDDVVVQTSNPAGTVVVYEKAVAWDDASTPSVTYDKASGSHFELGLSVVTAVAINAAGRSASCSFSVTTVFETTLPVITCPANVLLAAPDNNGLVVAYEPATATDAHSTPSVTHTPESGSLFSVGETTVTATATNRSGRSASCSFTVTVVGPGELFIDCADDLLIEATGPDGAVVSYAPAEAVGAESEITYDKPSGSRFSMGESTVTATATDEANNSVSCSFAVTVADTTPPAVFCPRNATVQTSDEAGAYFRYSGAGARDAVSTPSITYDHSGDESFPVGQTIVTATATDEAGNSSDCTFTVTVVLKTIDPPDAQEPETETNADTDRVPALAGGCDCSGAGAPGAALLLGIGAMLGRRRRGMSL